jgi:hypothetical protein
MGGGSGQLTPQQRCSPGERTPGTHCTGIWVDPRSGLETDARGKILSPLPGIEHRSPCRLARSQTLYWLSYPAHTLIEYPMNISPNRIHTDWMLILVCLLLLLLLFLCIWTLAYYIYEYAEPRWIDVDRVKPKNSQKDLFHCHLVHTNPTLTHPGAKSGHRCERPASNHLSHGTASCFMLRYSPRIRIENCE